MWCVDLANMVQLSCAMNNTDIGMRYAERSSNEKQEKEEKV